MTDKYDAFLDADSGQDKYDAFLDAEKRTRQEQMTHKPSGIPDRKATRYDPSTPAGKYIGNEAMEGIIDFSKLSGTTAIPLALTGSIVNTMFGTQFPNAGRIALRNTDAVTRSAEQFVDRSLLPPDLKTRYAGATAKSLSSGAIPGVGIVGVAKRPIVAAVSELLSGTLGGIGSEFGGDVSEATIGTRTPGELMGGLSGGAWGTHLASTPAAIARAPAHIGRKSGNKVIDAILEHKESLQNIKSAQATANRMQELVGERPPLTLADVSDSPTLKAWQKQLASKNAETLEKATENMLKKQGMLGTAINKAFPEQADTKRAAALFRNTAIKQMGAKANALEKRAQAIASQLETAPQQEVGDTLKRLHEASSKEASSMVKAARTEIYDDATKLGIEIDANALRNNLMEIASGDASKYQDIPTLYGKVLAGDANTASFEELHSMWREANRAYGMAARSGDASKLYFINQAKAAASKALNDASVANPEFAKKFEAFNDLYVKAKARPFKEGVGGRLSQPGVFGDRIASSDLVGKFFTPEGIDDFYEIYSPKTSVAFKETAEQSAEQSARFNKAYDALHDGIIDKFRDEVVKNGVVDQTAAKRFMWNNRETLNKLPDIRNEFASTQKMTDTLLGRQEKIVQAQKEFDANVLKSVAETDDVASTAQRALKDMKLMRQLLLPEKSRDSVMRAIAEQLPVVAAREGMLPGDFLRANSAKLKPIFDRIGPKHFDNLETISDYAGILARAEGLPQAHLDTAMRDSLEKLTGTTWASAISQYRATTITRQSSPTHMAVSMGGRLLAKIGLNKQFKLMEKALYDPEVAQDLALSLKAKGDIKPLYNKLRLHMFNSGIRVASDEDVQEQ